MMKRIYSIIILCVLGICAVNAQTLNSTQKKLKSDIFSYLRKEVTNLSDYSNTELKFTYNGTTYFVSVSPSDYSPMYVTLYAGFNLPETYDKGIVAKAGIVLNGYKGVKFYFGDDWIKLQAEMFISDVKTFSTSFHSYLNIIGTIRDAFDSEYEKAKSAYTISNSFISQFKSDNNQYIYPTVQNNNDNKLYISKVTLAKDYTILDMISYNSGQYQNCAIDKKCYLLVNGKKYSLLKAEGISYSPKYTDYPNYQSGQNVSLSFKLYFAPISSNTRTFDFSEASSNGWKLQGISLDASNVISVQGSIIETSVHSWQLISVECRNNKTIVKKKVTPKEAGTWINSSQEEFIEDADTGRKYYLTLSDIGFEGNRITIHDTKERYFYEVYPALPSSVKRINVSSGSQYYVKNLKIR